MRGFFASADCCTACFKRDDQMMEEMNHAMKRMLAQGAGSIGALLISYLLCRYLFFDLHLSLIHI